MSQQVQDLEIRLLLDAIRDRYGYDFHDYSAVTLKRRILHCLSKCDFQHISEVITRLLHDASFVNTLICTLTVTVSDFFRDPPVMRMLREEVLPHLATYSSINVWHAGIASGEEVYTMAILLKEAGLYDRVQIYATDINAHSLQAAREGVYSAEHWEKWSENYRLSGGKKAFSDYCHVNYGMLLMDPALRERVVFANHNLATDGVFAETQLILCRNVLIYFDPSLQNRALQLFSDSLVRGGILCLGTSESLRFSSVADAFTPLAEQERIFRKRSDLGRLPG